MQPTEAEIKAFEARIRAQYKGEAPTPTPKAKEEVPEDQKPQTYTIRSHVDISKPQHVDMPQIRDESGVTVTPRQKITKPSMSAYSNHDAQRIAIERIKADEDKAKKELTSEAILNRLNASERVIKKLLKRIDELEKNSND